MNVKRRLGQILLGIGIGVLIGALIDYARQDTQVATFSLGVALLFIATSLYLLRRP